MAVGKKGCGVLKGDATPGEGGGGPLDSAGAPRRTERERRQRLEQRLADDNRELEAVRQEVPLCWNSVGDGLGGRFECWGRWHFFWVAMLQNNNTMEAVAFAPLAPIALQHCPALFSLPLLWCWGLLAIHCRPRHFTNNGFDKRFWVDVVF